MNTQVKKFLSAPTAAVLIVLLTVFAAIAGAQITPLSALAVRGLTQDEINTYQLPATTERSGGLATIAVGQATYLGALLDITIPANQIAGVTWALTAPANSNAALNSSPLGNNLPAFEPSDRLIYQVAGRQLLRPDVPGIYTVTATITTVGAGTATVSQMLTASTYRGIQACSGCHANGTASTDWSMVNSWQNTLHASIFTNGINGADGQSYGPSCWGCHTVGYDTNATVANGGFSQIMAQLNWTPPAVLQAGNFAAMPAALQT
jgi:hypothetical protein